MNNDELIKRAIRVFHQRGGWIPQPGDVIAHPQDKYTYEVRTVANGVVTGFYQRDGQEVTADFPVDEVFDVNAVRDIALLYKCSTN